MFNLCLFQNLGSDTMKTFEDLHSQKHKHLIQYFCQTHSTINDFRLVYVMHEVACHMQLLNTDNKAETHMLIKHAAEKDYKNTNLGPRPRKNPKEGKTCEESFLYSLENKYKGLHMCYSAKTH